MSDPRTAPASARREGLAAELTALEDRFEYELEATLARAVEVEQAAEVLGEAELRLRARLVQANMSRRSGDLAAAARICWEVNAGAAGGGHGSLLSRTFVQLSVIYDSLGDAAAALEHAVSAAGYLDDSTPPRARAVCLMTLADALAGAGSFEAARERYRQAEQVTVTSGDIDLRIAILNNLAYADQSAGDLQRSWGTIERLLQVSVASGDPDVRIAILNDLAYVEASAGEMQRSRATVERLFQVAAAAGQQLEPVMLDTIARTEIALGR